MFNLVCDFHLRCRSNLNNNIFQADDEYFQAIYSDPNLRGWKKKNKSLMIFFILYFCRWDVLLCNLLDTEMMSPSALEDYSVVTKRVKKCCDREGEQKAEFFLFIKGRAWISECLIILLPHKL